MAEFGAGELELPSLAEPNHDVVENCSGAGSRPLSALTPTIR
jgi:hypothetical protein